MARMAPMERERVVVVTGASRGIGVAIARALAGPECIMVLAARDTAGLERTAALVEKAGARCVIVACDVGRAEDRERLALAAEAAGNIDVLVNNAAIEVPREVIRQTPEEIERQVQVNLLAPMLLTRRLLPGMIARRKGCIVMISSMSGKTATPYDSIYAATKYGLNGFAASLRIELAASGVHIGVVCPSFVSESGMWVDTGSKAPLLMREVSPAKVVAGVRRVLAGEGEVLVTPGPVRPLLAACELFPSLRPRIIRILGVTAVLKRRALRSL